MGSVTRSPANASARRLFAQNPCGFECSVEHTAQINSSWLRSMAPL
jgi:hypothetical protein